MNYIIKRTSQAAVTVLGVITITFGLIRLMPGGPLDYIQAQISQSNPGMSATQLNALVEAYAAVNPSEPIYVQYVNYVTSVLTGDLGQSFRYQEPVAQILGNALPWTLFVMTLALIFSFQIAVVLGAVMAYFEGSRFDGTASIVAIFMNSIPYYILGMVFIIVFGHRLGWFPTGGTYSAREVEAGLNLPFMLDALHHAALPALSFILTVFGMLALLMRGNCISILGEDYMRVAELRGLPKEKIALGYLGRNAVLPMYTEFMISIGFLFGGSIVLEEVFSYYGVGYRMLIAISSRDQTLMMGAFLIITLAVVIGVFIADLTYGMIDPRVKLGEES